MANTCKVCCNLEEKARYNDTFKVSTLQLLCALIAAIEATPEQEYDVNVTNSYLNVREGLSIPEHDYISAAYPTATSEVYTYKTGGSGGTTVATVTVTYTDATKTVLSSVSRT